LPRRIPPPSDIHLTDARDDGPDLEKLLKIKFLFGPVRGADQGERTIDLA
jgi:hypothetical protein